MIDRGSKPILARRELLSAVGSCHPIFVAAENDRYSSEQQTEQDNKHDINHASIFPPQKRANHRPADSCICLDREIRRHENPARPEGPSRQTTRSPPQSNGRRFASWFVRRHTKWEGKGRGGRDERKAKPCVRLTWKPNGSLKKKKEEK